MEKEKITKEQELFKWMIVDGGVCEVKDICDKGNSMGQSRE